jgi:hypothetical protein
VVQFADCCLCLQLLMVAFATCVYDIGAGICSGLVFGNVLEATRRRRCSVWVRDVVFTVQFRLAADVKGLKITLIEIVLSCSILLTYARMLAGFSYKS